MVADDLLHAETRLLGHARVQARRQAKLYPPRQPSVAAIAAVCVAGEIRSMALEAQMRRFVHTVVEPLQGDLFLVVSPKISQMRSVSSAANLATNGILRETTDEDTRMQIVEQMRPVSVRVHANTA